MPKAESPWFRSSIIDLINDVQALSPDESMEEKAAAILKQTREEIVAEAGVEPFNWKDATPLFIAAMKEADDKIESLLAHLTPVQRATYFTEKMGQHLAPELTSFTQAVSAISIFSAHALTVVQLFQRNRIKLKVLELLLKGIKE